MYNEILPLFYFMKVEILFSMDPQLKKKYSKIILKKKSDSEKAIEKSKKSVTKQLMIRE